MPKISLIMPFRARIKLFEAMMTTLVKTTANPMDLEILPAVDFDDEVVRPRIEELEDKYRYFGLQFHVVERSENFVQDYWNMLARQARGRWIMAINDDSEFETPGWDRLLDEGMSKKADELGDDIIMGLVKDTVRRTNEDPLYPHFSCWCLQSKEAVNALGYFYHPLCRVWGPDHIAAQMYHMLSCLYERPRPIHYFDGRKRLVSLTHIYIGHNHPVHGGRGHDEEDYYERMRALDGVHPHNITENMIYKEALKLQEYIDDKHRFKQ